MAVLARLDVLSPRGRCLAAAFVDWLAEAEREGLAVVHRTTDLVRD
jgi:hypothetical protein